jgi:predicted DCC family thiol-disulfide oxidoreductase YuxK
MNSNTDHIVLFDDVCVLCNSFAKFIINKDKKDIIRFSALQSQTAVAFNDKLVQQIDSIVLIENSKKIFYKSDAVIKIFAILNYPTWFCKILEFIPKSIRDFIYDNVAKRRYKVFGKYEQCPIPPSEIRHKFLD